MSPIRDTGPWRRRGSAPKLENVRSFIDNIELWLSFAGLLVIFDLPRLVGVGDSDTWKVSAEVAIAVGVLHGCLFWIVRRRQRAIRRQVIEELRTMLRDRVNNQLAVITMALSEVDDPALAESMTDLQGAVARMSELVGSLSDESLRAWQERYAEVVARAKSTPAKDA